MQAKGLAIGLLCLLWVSGQASALTKPVVELDAWGSTRYCRLEKKELKFYRANFTQPQTLYGFTREVSAFDFKIENSRFYLVFATEDPTRESGVYLTFSRDNGRTFSDPALITEEGNNPSLAIAGELVWIAWEGKEDICFSKSEDGGKFFSRPHSLRVTGEVLSSPSLAIDKSKRAHLSCLSQNPDIGLNRVLYARAGSRETRAIFESHDDLINPGLKVLDHPENGLLVFWQKEYMERRESYFSVSLDAGQNFSKERLLDHAKDLLNLCVLNEKLFALTFDQGPAVREIELPPLCPPNILYPAPDSALNSSDLKLFLALPGSDPLLCKIELSEDGDFSASRTRNFTELISCLSSESMRCDLPVKLPDGTYFARAQAFDGIKTSSPGPTTSFRIDNLSPQLLTLEAERIKEKLTLRGKASESPVRLTINGNDVPLVSATFESHFRLEPGENLFTLILSDEAGNSCITTQAAFYDPACPEITLINPEPGAWVRPESTVVIEARVSDLQGDIEDGAEARIMIDNSPMESTLSFDQEEKSLFGMISLPEDLGEGEHSLTILLCDRSGNEGRETFPISIDGSPPEIGQAPGEPCFTNSQISIAIPLMDEGAGIDPSGTLFEISNISCEGSASAEGEKYVFTPDAPLPAGTYEAEIIPRDLIGNIGEPVAFCLVVDTTPPLLTLTSTLEPNTTRNRITIQGKVEEEYPACVKIYNNGKEVASFSLSSQNFSREINLSAGCNELLIKALDKSGNQAATNLSTIADFAAASGLIANCAHGPNPFSPRRDLPGAFSAHGKGMVFSYALNQPADVKILIYDLTGTLIWVKEVKNTAAGVTAWSGEKSFGGVAENGIYPYVFSATAGETSEIRRGKILVYQ
jgi:hypothetical protein